VPDPEVITSPLCRNITVDGTSIQVDIYRGEDESRWILEVIDREGIRSFLENVPEPMH
jgi:hypothetical protein